MESWWVVYSTAQALKGLDERDKYSSISLGVCAYLYTQYSKRENHLDHDIKSSLSDTVHDYMELMYRHILISFTLGVRYFCSHVCSSKNIKRFHLGGQAKRHVSRICQSTAELSGVNFDGGGGYGCRVSTIPDIWYILERRYFVFFNA
jgi:hypothetical protein